MAGAAPLGWLGFGAPGRRGGGSFIGRRGLGHVGGPDATGREARRGGDGAASARPAFAFGRQPKAKGRR
jgi:hypothetical protein